MDYKARGYDGGNASPSSKAKKLRKKGAKVVSSKKVTKTKTKTEPFSGVLTLNSAAFGRFYACTMNPGEPTAGAVRGAALLRKLYNKSR